MARNLAKRLADLERLYSADSGNLVHIQDRFRAMSYGNEHETSHLRTYAF